MIAVEPLLASVDRALDARGFRRIEAKGDGVCGCWIRRTWFTNRALVVLRCPDGEDPALFARTQRRTCAAAAGFFVPLLYAIGMQVIVLGGTPATHPKDAVDRIDNQWCVLQALHLVDLERGTFQSAATWGQIVSGPDQQAVVVALQEAATPIP